MDKPKKISQRFTPFSRGIFEKGRFLIVGSLNTIVDFLVFNILVNVLHMPVIAANLFSTSVAMLLSLLLNKHVVFRDKSPLSRRQFLLFISVTLTSLWVVQSLVIWVLIKEFPLPLTTLAHDLARSSSLHLASTDFLRNNIAKVVATLASLVWNYFFYKRLVFKKDD